MRVKILNFILVIAIISALVGCSGANAPEFPMYFMRNYDGAVISVGMTRDDIENILEEDPYFEVNEERLSEMMPGFNMSMYIGAIDQIGVLYDDNNVVVSIVAYSNEWGVANGFSVGDNIQSVINSDVFENIFHLENGQIAILDNPEYIIHGLLFNYDENGKITNIQLTRLPYWARTNNNVLNF